MAHKIELAEILGELHRLVDNALLDLIVAAFDEAGQREVLAQRMAFEPVIGEDAAEIGVVGEQDAIQIPGLALEPVGRAEHRGDRRHRREFVGRNLHANAHVVAERKQVVDHVEALFAFRIIDAADVHELAEQTVRRVAQERQHLDDRLRRNIDDQLALDHGCAGHVGGKRRSDGFAEILERLGH